MLASLPMYDLPMLSEWTDRWWDGLRHAARRHGVHDLPAGLDRRDNRHAVWQAEELAFSQICGFPMNHAYRNRLRPILTPCYAADGCDGPRYRSVLLVHEDSPAQCLADLEGAQCACNEPDSQSGTNSLARAAAGVARNARFFSGVTFTGAHIESMRLVREGAAAVCAVDCVTHALLSRHEPDAVAGLKRIGFTPSAPGLPYVAAPSTSEDTVERLRQALRDALDDPDLSAVRDALLIAGAEPLTINDYNEISAWPRDVLGPNTGAAG